MNKWTDEWTNKQINEGLWEQKIIFLYATSEQKSSKTNEQTTEQRNKLNKQNEWINKQMNESTNEWINQIIHERINK